MASEHGSLEVYFSYLATTSNSLEMITNVQGLKQFHVGPLTLQDITVKISATQEDVDEPVFIRVQTILGSTVIDQSDFSTYSEFASMFNLRVFFFDQFISVLLNDKWVYSYAFSSVSYQDETTAKIKLDGGTTTITDIRRVELADGREAIYVDYESNTENAIQSIIQQRPILVIPHVNRRLSFTYTAERDTIDAVFGHRYSEDTTQPQQLSSDGLVYGEDVGVSIDLETAKQVGFITKLYRLPDLSTGAIPAARTMQRQARERRVVPEIVQRLDPRVELTDVINVDLVVTGTQRHIERQIIVESIQISVRDGESTMTISGRKKS